MSKLAGYEDKGWALEGWKGQISGVSGRWLGGLATSDNDYTLLYLSVAKRPPTSELSGSMSFPKTSMN